MILLHIESKILVINIRLINSMEQFIFIVILFLDLSRIFSLIKQLCKVGGEKRIKFVHLN